MDMWKEKNDSVTWYKSNLIQICYVIVYMQFLS